MIVSAIVAMSLLVPVAIDRDAVEAVWQKSVSVGPLVTSATECIARAVGTDSRISAALGSAALNELIVESIPACASALRAMIDAYDRQFGDGAGETFFMGPYLDALPGAVNVRIKLR
jgi:hypothetical protein